LPCADACQGVALHGGCAAGNMPPFGRDSQCGNRYPEGNTALRLCERREAIRQYHGLSSAKSALKSASIRVKRRSNFFSTDADIPGFLMEREYKMAVFL
jgi:hypothetical protein